MGVNWKNVMNNQARGMHPVAAFHAESERVRQQNREDYDRRVMAGLLRQLDVTEEQLRKVEDYCKTADADAEIGFEHRGQYITNIFTSPCTRYEYDIRKAAEVYGIRNVRDFCKCVLRHQKRDKRR